MKRTSIGFAALLSLMGGLALFSAEPASAGACQTYVDKANQVFGNLIQDSCLGINTQASLTNNPFVYTNTDGGCDSGLQLPGLPDFGKIALGSINACEIIQAVTSQAVDTVNASVRNTMTQTVNGINSQSQSTLGTNAIGGGTTNIGDMVTDQIKAATAAGN